MQKLFFAVVLVVILAGLPLLGLSNTVLSSGDRTATDGIKVGAYYFHGWSGKTDTWHLPDKLKEEFPEREPVWGWYTDSVELMEMQIDYAADNGLDFFAFCWYHSTRMSQWIVDALNEGLELYLDSVNRYRLQFCLLVANHDHTAQEGFSIGPDEWQFCTDEWVDLFQQPGYLKINRRPVIVFFRHDLLLEEWGTPDALADACSEFDEKCVAVGLKEPLIGCDARPWDNLSELKHAGFDFLTAYNYGNADSAEGANFNQSYSQLRTAHNQIWNRFAVWNEFAVESVRLPYVPVVTTGWDMRPLETSEPEAFYYTPRTAQNIAEFVSDAVTWVEQNPDKTLDQPLIVLYSWNEYGEGGYVTPTKSEGDAVLRELKEVMLDQEERSQYRLTIYNSAGGSVSLPGEGGFVYEAGTEVSLLAIPNSGYQFLAWDGNTSTIADVDDASTTITMNGDCSITADFEEISEHTLAISSTPGGSVAAPGEGEFVCEEGTVVGLEAVSEDGYRFVEWTGDVDTIANVDAASTTIAMNGDYSITANFEEVPSGGGCFIATAAYGTPMAEEIEVLREFRDGYLMTNPLGQAVVDLYYRVSPPIAEFINEHPSLKPIARPGLLPVVAISAVVVNTTTAEKMAIVGLLVLVSVALAVWTTRRRGRGPGY